MNNALTETEARLKWCPFARTGMYGEGAACSSTVSVNRDPRYPKHHDLSPCIASDCMAWRWVAEIHTFGDGEIGYCGLAGKLP